MTRLLLVYDVNGWAWWFRTNDLWRFAPPGLDVEIVSYTDLAKRYPPAYLANYCVLNYSWTMCPLPLVSKAKRNVAVVTSGGMLYERQSDDWRSRGITSRRNAVKARERLPQFDGLIAVNREVYEASKRLNPNTVLVPSGVNTDFWCYRRRPGLFKPPLRVGWSGQRRCWVKGLDKVLRPLQKRCPQYDWRVNDRNFNEAMNREEMREWYWDLDVFVSTSIIEGTPSPPFEAAACGRPILCTDAGILADWPELDEMGLVTPAPRRQADADRAVGWFASKLAELDDVARHGSLSGIGAALRSSVVARYSYREAGIAKRYLEFVAGENQ